MTREEAKLIARSRDCSCIAGKDRDNNYNECLDKVFDYFENQLKAKEEALEIGKVLYHPCSLYIIPYKIICIRTYEGISVYEAQATGDVGASGRVKVLLKEDRNGTIRFIDLLEDYEYGAELGELVEGIYCLTKSEARLVFYNIQYLLTKNDMDNKKRLYLEAKTDFEKVSKLINEIKAEIKLTCKKKE